MRTKRTGNDMSYPSQAERDAMRAQMHGALAQMWSEQKISYEQMMKLYQSGRERARMGLIAAQQGERGGGF